MPILVSHLHKSISLSFIPQSSLALSIHRFELEEGLTRPTLVCNHQRSSNLHPKRMGSCIYSQEVQKGYSSLTSLRFANSVMVPDDIYIDPTSGVHTQAKPLQPLLSKIELGGGQRLEIIHSFVIVYCLSEKNPPCHQLRVRE